MGSDIAAGPSNSVVIDKQGMYWMAGKVIRLPLSASPLLTRRSGKTLAMVRLASPTLVSVTCKTSCMSSDHLDFAHLLTYGVVRGCKVLHAACGGVTHWALAPSDDDDGGVMTIAFGQGASNGQSQLPVPHTITDVLSVFQGELGLGPNESKSATKPTRNQPLTGIDVFQ